MLPREVCNYAGGPDGCGQVATKKYVGTYLCTYDSYKDAYNGKCTSITPHEEECQPKAKAGFSGEAFADSLKSLERVSAGVVIQEMSGYYLLHQQPKDHHKKMEVQERLSAMKEGSIRTFLG